MSLVGVAAVLAGMVVVALQRERHQQGSNYVPPARFVAELPAGRTVCQREPQIPAGVGVVRLYAGTFGEPGPATALRITGAGAPPVGAVRPDGWREPRLEFPVPVTRRARMRVRICVRNTGSRRLVLAGAEAPAVTAARVAGRSTGARVRVEYLRAEQRSWLGFAPLLADRVVSTRVAAPGAITLAIWALLAGVVALGVLGLLLSEVRR